MLITITLGQLILLLTCGIVAIIFIYMLLTLKNLQKTVAEAASIISRNEKNIAGIMAHAEHIAANLDDMSGLLSGREHESAAPGTVPHLGDSLIDGIRDLQSAFQEISASIKTFRAALKH